MLLLTGSLHILQKNAKLSKQKQHTMVCYS